MSDIMPDCGGAWVPDDSGGGGVGQPPLCVLEQISKLAEHGIVISGVITWMQAQIDTLGGDIWRSLAERCFLATEVTAAKDALRNAKGQELLNLVPDFKTNRSGPNKKSKELDDIKKAIGALTQANQMPLVLATAQQMLRCPQSWGVPESPTSQDVMGKIYHLEKALGDSIELHKDQMNQVREEIISIKNLLPKSTSVPDLTVAPDTPSTKKRKLDQQQTQQQQGDQLQLPQQQQSYAGIAGISPLTQQQHGIRLLQNVLQKTQTQVPQPQVSKNICVGSAGGGDGSKLSGDVSLVASGVAKDCTEEDLKAFLADKGINVVEIEKLTKPEVMDLVRTITFRVAVKAADYEAALKPEVWPYRVGVRHYRAPRRPPTGSSWQGQSSQAGGKITSEHPSNSRGYSSSPMNNGGAGHPSNGHHLPVGHPGRVGPKQQIMGPRNLNSIEMSNFWNILQTLSGSGQDGGLSSHP